jgi:hypothetical protein
MKTRQNEIRIKALPEHLDCVDRYHQKSPENKSMHQTGTAKTSVADFGLRDSQCEKSPDAFPNPVKAILRLTTGDNRNPPVHQPEKPDYRKRQQSYKNAKSYRSVSRNVHRQISILRSILIISVRIPKSDLAPDNQPRFSAFHS